MGHAEGVNQIVLRLTKELAERLDANLFSCILYGSAVRGEHVVGHSDINLLIVLSEATPEAHSVIAETIRSRPRIEPFVLGRKGFDRSRLVFALKFASIQRNYRVLHGADILADFTPDRAMLRFLCEQSIRNLRLRLKHAFITFGHDRSRYSKFVFDAFPGIRVALTQILHCEGIDVPRTTRERVPVFSKAFSVDAGILVQVMEARANGRTFSIEEVNRCHDGLFSLLTHAVNWIESRWPMPSMTQVS